MSNLNDLVMQLKILDDPQDIGDTLASWMDEITQENFEQIIPFLNQKTVVYAGYMDLFRRWQDWCKISDPLKVLSIVDNYSIPMGWKAWAQKHLGLDDLHRETINSMLDQSKKTLPEKIDEFSNLVKKPKTWLN